MLSRTPNWLLGPNFGFGTDGVFVAENSQFINTFPPVSFYMITEDGLNFIVTESDDNIIEE